MRSSPRFSGGIEKQRRDFSAILMCIMRGIPFRNLGNAHFLGFVSEMARCRCDGMLACQHCSIIKPSSAASRVQFIEACILNKLQQALEGVQSICLTADEWTHMQGRTILGMTGHWFTHDFVLQCAVVGIDELTAGRCASDLVRQMQNTVDRLRVVNREHDQLTPLTFIAGSLTSDNTAVMVRSGEDFIGEELRRMPGFDHLAELCLKDALKDNELIKRVRMAVNTVRKSSLAKDLRSRCLNLEYESLISPADTRWS